MGTGLSQWVSRLGAKKGCPAAWVDLLRRLIRAPVAWCAARLGLPVGADWQRLSTTAGPWDVAMNQAWLEALARRVETEGHVNSRAEIDTPIDRPGSGGAAVIPAQTCVTEQALWSMARIESRDGASVAVGSPPVDDTGIDFEIIDDYDWAATDHGNSSRRMADDETTLKLEFAQLCIAQADQATARRILESLPATLSDAEVKTQSRLLAQCRNVAAGKDIETPSG